MSLDQELRSALKRAADRCEAPLPDVETLMAGGRVVRRRQRVARVVAGAAVAAIVGVGIGVVSWNDQTEDQPAAGTDIGKATSLPPTTYRSPSQSAGQTEPESMPFFLDLFTGKQTLVPPGLAQDGVGVRGRKVYSAYDVSPNGRRVVFGTCHESVCSPDDKLFVAGLDGTDLREIQLPEGLTGHRPAWSTDGTKLVYQLRHGESENLEVGNLVVQDVISGRMTQITDLPLDSSEWWFLWPSLSPDGQNVIFHQPRLGWSSTVWDAWSVPITGGEPTLLMRDAQYPVYLADGKSIAFVQPAPGTLGGPSIQIADAEGHHRTLVEANTSIGWLTASPDGTRIAYQDDGSIYVVQAWTGKSSKVAVGDHADWVDNDTLLVAPQP